VPFHEDDLWNGYPEETNASYGLAKKMIAGAETDLPAAVQMELDLLVASQPVRAARQSFDMLVI
jgi:hypothetical protein